MLKIKVLVIGDACIDHYVYGQCLKLNPESAAPLLTWQRSEQKFGMALNVKDNLLAFGCEVDTLVPDQLSVKTRFVDIRNGQQLLRLDQDTSVDPCVISQDTIKSYDAIVVSDYNKGFVDYDTLSVLEDHAECPVFVDTKKTDLGRYKKLFFKLNLLEYQRLTSHPNFLITTLGDRGARFKNSEFSTESSTVVDVCGAGDMFLSALAFSYVALFDQNINESIKFANRASGISIQHQGVYVLTPDDVKKLFTQNEQFLRRL